MRVGGVGSLGVGVQRAAMGASCSEPRAASKSAAVEGAPPLVDLVSVAPGSEGSDALECRPALPPNYEPLHVRGLRNFESRRARTLLEDLERQLSEVEARRSGGGPSGKETLVEETFERTTLLLRLAESRCRRFADLGPYCEQLPEQVCPAAAEGDSDYVRFCLDVGIPVDHKDALGLTPLMHATLRNRISVARLLLQRRADIASADGNGATALHYAVQFNHLHVLREMFDVADGARHVTLKDGRGRTAIDYARRPDREDALRFLSYRMGGRQAVAQRAVYAQIAEDCRDLCGGLRRQPAQHVLAPERKRARARIPRRDGRARAVCGTDI